MLRFEAPRLMRSSRACGSGTAAIGSGNAEHISGAGGVPIPSRCTSRSVQGILRAPQVSGYVAVLRLRTRRPAPYLTAKRVNDGANRLHAIAGTSPPPGL